MTEPNRKCGLLKGVGRVGEGDSRGEEGRGGTHATPALRGLKREDCAFKTSLS